jgi:hypothetical protein
VNSPVGSLLAAAFLAPPLPFLAGLGLSSPSELTSGLLSSDEPEVSFFFLAGDLRLTPALPVAALRPLGGVTGASIAVRAPTSGLVSRSTGGVREGEREADEDIAFASRVMCLGGL